jgi:hypothetical protein
MPRTRGDGTPGWRCVPDGQRESEEPRSPRAAWLNRTLHAPQWASQKRVTSDSTVASWMRPVYADTVPPA